MLSNLIDRIKLPFRKEKELYSALYNILGFYPHNITFYKVALMHKSLGHRATEKELKALEKANKKAGKSRKSGTSGKLGKRLNNERLEFLGDAMLDALVGAIVYKRFPGKSEGFLTNARSKMVQRETLGKLAQQMGLTRLILANNRNMSHNNYMGGNAFEALVGAIYLDRGYDACCKFWEERVMGKFMNVDKVAYTVVNFKSKLLEWSQKNRIKLEFQLEDQSQDENGSPVFIYTTVLEGIKGCKAEGFSKKESQQKASELTLKKLRTDTQFIDRVFAAKSATTQMEEMPVSVAPDVEQPKESGVIITINENCDAEPKEMISKAEQTVDALSLDDVVATPKEKTREEIIDEAEAQAYEH